jgi:FHS family glucose/mannose:H+ symporter-like MFS transporter
VTDAVGPARPLVVSSFLVMLAASIAVVYGAATPAVSAATGVPPATVGQLTTIHGVGSFVGFLVWTRVSRTRRTDHVLRGSVGLLFAGAVAIALNPVAGAGGSGGEAAFLALAGTAAVVGLAFGVSIVAANTVMATSGASAGLLNAMHGVYGLGAIVLPLLVGARSLRAAAVAAAVAALVTLPWLRATPDLRLDDGPVEVGDGPTGAGGGDGPTGAGGGDGGPMAARVRRSLRRAWTGTGSRPWVWMFVVAIGVEIGAGAWAATHLVGVGVSSGRAAVAVSGFFAVFTVTRFVVAPVVSRFRPRDVVVTAHLVAATAAAAAALTPRPAIAWALVGVGVGPVFPTTLAWLTQATGDRHGARRLMIGGALGGVLLPGLIGLLVGAVGAVAVPWAVAAFAVIAAGVTATLPPTDGRRPEELGAAASATT